VTQDNTRTFTTNWTGTGEVTYDGEENADNEQLTLDAGEYMESEVVNTGAVTVTLALNQYVSGDSVTVYYKTGSGSDLSGESYVEYTTPFTSDGYVQVKVQAPA
jgi:hypothetical protein